MDISKLTDQEALVHALSMPDGYAKLRLGINMHPKQAEVLNGLFDKKKVKVCVRCANEVGKTSVIAVVSILYAIEMWNANVVSTAAIFRQITKQLIPNLKNHAHLFSNWQFLDNQIKIKGETRYIGFATTEDAKFQGYHETPERPLLIIVDEAAGVKDDIFQSIARCNPTWLLIMGSPLGPEGFFYQVETDTNIYSAFQHFKITKLDCLKKDGWWLDEAEMEDFIRMWTPENPLVLSSVYAEFATNIEGGVITLADIEKNIRNPAIQDASLGQHVALDFSAGGDENVIAFRNGNYVSLVKCWRNANTMAAAREFCEELDTLRMKYGVSACDVSGDADGLGLPIIQRMAEIGWKVNEFHGGSSAKDITCKNRITDCWINACRKIRNGGITMPNDQKLKLQLTSRKSFMNTTGKLQLESKEDMRARGIPSPDRADAFCMAVGDPISGILTFARVPVPSVRKYNLF